MKYNIDNELPLPPRTRVGLNGRPRHEFPFATMAVGDSFEVFIGEEDSAKKALSRVTGAASRYSIRNPECRFSCRTVFDSPASTHIDPLSGRSISFRVWRVEPKKSKTEAPEAQ